MLLTGENYSSLLLAENAAFFLSWSKASGT